MSARAAPRTRAVAPSMNIDAHGSQPLENILENPRRPLESVPYCRQRLSFGFPLMEANLATVLVTGTGKGIGYTTALTLARAGHTVYAALRNPARAKELSAEFAQQALPIRVSVMDVDSDDSVADAVAAIHLAAGDIDVLVNNAGVGYSRLHRRTLHGRHPRHHGDQLLRRSSLHQSCDSPHAQAPQRLHHQRHLHRRARRHLPAWRLRRVQTSS